VAWDQHLIAEPEGPSFISRTVTHRLVDRRCSWHTARLCRLGRCRRSAAIWGAPDVLHRSRKGQPITPLPTWAARPHPFLDRKARWRSCYAAPRPASLAQATHRRGRPCPVRTRLSAWATYSTMKSPGEVLLEASLGFKGIMQLRTW